MRGEYQTPVQAISVTHRGLVVPPRADLQEE